MRSVARYVAKVVDVDDPVMMGRVRVRVAGLHDDVADADLPWAVPADQSREFNSMQVPVKGREVYVTFQDGDMQEVEYAGLVRQSGEVGLPDHLKVNYPHRKGFETEYGVKGYRDEVDGTMRFTSPLGGTRLELKGDGTLEAESDVRIRAKVGGSTVTLEPDNIVASAPSRIRLTVGGSSIIINPSSIILSSPYVNVTS